jgi:hypothetical protein
MVAFYARVSSDQQAKRGTIESQIAALIERIVAEGAHVAEKIMERNLRGKLHGAKRGSINVLSTAPYDYRYIRKQLDGAPAQYVIELPQAATVRAIFKWIGMERLSIGEVVRRLGHCGFSHETRDHSRFGQTRRNSQGRNFGCVPD